MSTNNINRSLLHHFISYCHNRDCQYIDSLVVTTYVFQHNINVRKNKFIKTYILSQDNIDLMRFLHFLKERKILLSLEDLVELFEFVISPKEKEINGAVYTPQYIREFIVKYVLNKIPKAEWAIQLYGDISCGCGGFFITLANILHHELGLSYATIYRNNLYGVDIKNYSINRTKLLLSLLAIENGEDNEEYAFNLYVANSLEFNFMDIPAIREKGGLDCIVGNPPYVGASKIDAASRALLCKWSVSSSGKADLYLPFFQIALENLADNGILGYITVNNFYRSLNGKSFREYMSARSLDMVIIDFGSEQVFRKRSTYTCLCFIRKQIGKINYVQLASDLLGTFTDDSLIHIEYSSVSDHKGWLLRNDIVTSNILKIENTGTKLGDMFSIRNGFATLKNDVYILNIVADDTDFYIHQTKDGQQYKIEKSICRDVIKPNTLKDESELDEKMEKIIFPYITSSNKLVLIDESTMTTKYRHAYQYLEKHRTLLDERDKGAKQYEAWYAYGRRQALNINGYRLLFPYLAENANFVLSTKRDLLFYNGYALISSNLEDLFIVKRILKSKLFWYYIKHTSKPYGGNFYALAKNYVKNFGIVQLNDENKEIIINSSDDQLDLIICSLYGVDINTIV